MRRTSEISSDRLRIWNEIKFYVTDLPHFGDKEKGQIYDIIFDVSPEPE